MNTAEMMRILDSIARDRKIEKAMELRKAGARIALVHESDFHDAVQDRSESGRPGESR